MISRERHFWARQLILDTDAIHWRPSRNMTGRSSMRIAGRARIAILVTVAALCVVPALVRATFSGSTSTPIRLNRGFRASPREGHHRSAADCCHRARPAPGDRPLGHRSTRTGCR